MLSCAVASTCALRPAAASSGARRSQVQQRVPVGLASRKQLSLTVCRASEEPQSAAEAQQAAAPAAEPASRPAPVDMKNEPDALGPVGNFLMATLLVFLCGASVLFTVGRQFQEDMVPMTAEMMASLE